MRRTETQTALDRHRNRGGEQDHRMIGRLEHMGRPRGAVDALLRAGGEGQQQKREGKRQSFHRKLLSDRVVDGDKLGTVGEGGLDLHGFDHFGDASHALIGAHHTCARLHRVGDAAHATRQPPPHHHRGKRDQKLVFSRGVRFIPVS